MTHSFPTRRSSERGAATRGHRCNSRPAAAGADRDHLRPLRRRMRTPRRCSRALPHLRGDLPQVRGLLKGSDHCVNDRPRSEEHTSELQSLMRITYAVFCLKKKTHTSTYEQV